MKILGAILVILSCTGMGMYYSGLVKGRVTDLKDMRKNITILRGNIKYANTTLPEAIGSLAHRNSDNFREFFASVEQDLLTSDGMSFVAIWDKEIKTHIINTYMNQQDREQLTHLGETLGYLDKEMQLKTIDLYIEQLEQDLEDAVHSLKEKTRLYNTLGVLSGLFLTVILL